MSIFIYIYTHIMYAMRNLFVLHKTFSKIWIHSTPTLPWRFALAPQPLPACKAPWDISNQLCLGGDCERNTWPWNFPSLSPVHFAQQHIRNKAECATTFGMTHVFSCQKFHVQFLHPVTEISYCWTAGGEKKLRVLPNFILVISFTLYIMYIISAYLFPQVAWFHPNPSLHRATDVPPAPRWARRAVAASRGHRSPWAAESWTNPVNHPWTNRSVLF